VQEITREQWSIFVVAIRLICVTHHRVETCCGCVMVLMSQENSRRSHQSAISCIIFHFRHFEFDILIVVSADVRSRANDRIEVALYTILSIQYSVLSTQ